MIPMALISSSRRSGRRRKALRLFRHAQPEKNSTFLASRHPRQLLQDPLACKAMDPSPLLRLWAEKNAPILHWAAINGLRLMEDQVSRSLRHDSAPFLAVSGHF